MCVTHRLKRLMDGFAVCPQVAGLVAVADGAGRHGERLHHAQVQVLQLL